MKPSRADAQRGGQVEFQPPRNYLCYLRDDSFVFLSGYTSAAETLETQVPDIIKAVAGGLVVAGSMWDKLVKVSLFLHRSQKLEVLKQLLGRGPALPANCHVEFGFVDGYAGDKSCTRGRSHCSSRRLKETHMLRCARLISRQRTRRRSSYSRASPLKVFLSSLQLSS